MKNPKELEEKLGIAFHNDDLLKEALTHRSYLNENPEWPHRQNERLEYLGDAVLELLVTEELFKRFPEEQEGKLTALRAALVNYQMLSRVARELSLEKFIYLSKGEARDFGKARDVILANAVEAFFGAVYLDQGYAGAKALVMSAVIPHLDEVLAEKLYLDPKSVLQEYAQDKYKATPTYRVLKEEGPDHQRVFTVAVFIGEREAAQGAGTSKQEAETKAALAALDEFSGKEEKPGE